MSPVDQSGTLIEADTCPTTGCVRFHTVPEPDAASVVEWAERVLLNGWQIGRGHIMVTPAALGRLLAIAKLAVRE